MRVIRSFVPTAVLVVILSVLMVSGCTESPEDPVIGPGGGDGDPRPVPEGVLLGGNDNDPAKGALVDLPPYPVNAADISSDEFMMTRMGGVINPTATVKEVNDVLITTGVRIDAMTTGNPVVSLNIPPLPGRLAADSLASLLSATSAFLFAFPEYAASVNSAGQKTETHRTALSELPVDPEDSSIVHLTPPRAPAAWNAKRLAIANASPIPVLVADVYWELTAHPEMQSQTFSGGGNAYQLETDVGNHGFHVAGIIGARHDSSKSTGIHPAAELTTQIRSIPMTGFGWSGKLTEIGLVFPSAGKFVLNTSLGYNDPDFSEMDYAARVLLALEWRKIMLRATGRIVHATAAGNDGDETGDGAKAEYASPFTSSAMVANLLDLIPAGELTADEMQVMNTLWNDYVSSDPSMAFKTVHTIVVGNSRTDGTENPGSSRPSDVRMIGTDVYGPCVVPDQGTWTPPLGCDGTRALYTGTSMASPQVAGLAAYLWNLKPSLSVGDLRSVIVNSYEATGGVIDMYDAVLRLDGSVSSAAVRASILDVAGSGPTPGGNGAFDHHDIKLYLDRFAEYRQARESAGQTLLDYSRYDLNGNGITGDTTGQTGTFDLDVNSPPQYSTVTGTIGPSEKDFDETDLSDLDILCYYAWSPLFTGEAEARDTLLRDCVDSDTIVVEVNFPSSIPAGGTAELAVRAGYRADGMTVNWAVGIDVSLDVTRGTADEQTGSTDVNGWFKTNITADNEPGYTLEIDITVSDVFGDTTRRTVTANISDELAIEAGFPNEPAFPPFITTAPDTMIVRAGPRLPGGIIDYQPGFDIFLQVNGGSASPSSGTTDVTDKLFATRVDFDPSSDSMMIVITASKDGNTVVDTVIAKKPAGPRGRVNVAFEYYQASAGSNAEVYANLNTGLVDQKQQQFGEDSLTTGTTGTVNANAAYSYPEWGFSGSANSTASVTTSAVYDTAGNIVSMSAGGTANCNFSATEPSDTTTPDTWGVASGGGAGVGMIVIVSEGNVQMDVSAFIESSPSGPGGGNAHTANVTLYLWPPDGPRETYREGVIGEAKTFNLTRILVPGTQVSIGFSNNSSAGIHPLGGTIPGGSSGFSGQVTFTPFGSP